MTEGLSAAGLGPPARTERSCVRRRMNPDGWVTAPLSPADGRMTHAKEMLQCPM
jgi:hypothetical protein